MRRRTEIQQSKISSLTGGPSFEVRKSAILLFLRYLCGLRLKDCSSLLPSLASVQILQPEE
jgi:hypothetical protein